MQQIDRRHQLTALIAGNIKPDAVPPGQWPHLIPLAIRHGLGLMLFWALKPAEYYLSDPDIREPLVQSALQSAMAWIRHEDGIHSITRALSHADIPALWIKGAALAQTVYPEPALRPM